MSIDFISTPQALPRLGAVMRRDAAAEVCIYTFMLEHSGDFEPAFAEGKDVAAYARKIHTYANTYEIWQGERLAALMALYLNAEKGLAYIPYICTAHSGMTVRGLGSLLLSEATGLPLPYSKVRLEVRKTNAPAIRLYARHGFKEIEDRGEKILMELEINRKLGS